MTPAHAGPTGGKVTVGEASIHQIGDTTTINQSSQDLSLSWQSFNTSGEETINFVQPSSSAIAVNRIFDINGTQFMGKLNANGHVYLINPNGVLFGAGSQVNVGGLVASTLDIDDAALKGPVRQFSGAGTGSIVNRGDIAVARGGYVAFLGNRVSNQGSINAPTGSVALGAGSDVTLSFAGNSLVNMQVNKSTLDNLAENGGLIRADAGAVILTAGAKDAVLASVVNNTGLVQARTMENVNGTIVLGGGQQSTVSNSGTLDSSGTAMGQQGGTVKVLGDKVALAAASKIDVSGDTDGGTVLVGGNFLGAGPERNALTTNVAAGSAIHADAISRGNGGQVAVWSNDTTSFDGSISARGGAQGGDGGQVETSGHTLKVSASAAVDTAAGRGTTGSWLLDPADITIGNRSLWGPSVSIDVDSVALTRALNTTDVTIKTTASLPACTGVACTSGSGASGDIRILDPIGGVADFNNGGYVYNWVSPKTLTLSAYNDIRFVIARNVTTAAGTGDVAGAIEAQGGGNIVLRTDNAGRGQGTVRFDDPNSSYIYADSGSTVNIFYNPGRDTNGAWVPTDYSIYNVGNPSAFNAYMLVNFAANVGSKTYDGTTTASLNGLTVVGGAPSGISIDTSYATATFQNKNVGANKAVTISGVTLNGANANAYAINGLDNKTATIAKADLAVTGVSASNKTYDGTTATTLSGSAAVTAIGGDVVAVSGTGTGAFASKNAGTGKTVTVAGYTLSGADAGNYNVVQPTGLVANINKATLAVSGLSANNKTYDGTTAATLSGTATVAAFGSDAVAVSGSGNATFADKNAGIGKSVTVGSYTLSGADAGNYNLVQPSSLTATINKAGLLLAGLSVGDKVYDGTTAATLSGSASVTPIGADVVSVSGSGSAAFADKNAGTGKAVNVGGYTLSGTDAGNYNLVMPGGLTANIGKADISVSGVSANDKVYDSTITATLAGTATVSAIGSDVVSVTGIGTGIFADKNVGTGKNVTVSGFTLRGADAGNYNVVQPTGLMATISKANLAVSDLTANNKTYDGTTAVTLSGNATVVAFGSDAVSVSGTGTGSFANKNAGSAKSVTVGGFALSGRDAGNYNIVQPTGLTATINKAGLQLAGLSVSDKVYDGTTTATLSGSANVTPIGADVVSVSGSGSAVFADKNVGIGKAVNVSGYTLSGADAGNYNLLQLGGSSANIAKADLAVAGVSANNKTYDGTTAATLSGSAVVSAFGSDVVTVSGSGTGAFVDKNVGIGKAVTVAGYSLTGADAGNYNLVAPFNFTADIARAALNINGLTARNKTYDATTAATLAGSAAVSAFGSDVVSVTGTSSAAFADKNAGSGKSVAVTGYTLSGADADNYTVVQPTGLTATIDKASLGMTGLSVADKVYDGTSAATLAGTAVVTRFGGDDVSVSGSGSAVFADKNAGNGKAVKVSGYTLTGADAGNYNLLQAVGLSANIAKADLAVTGLSANNKSYDGTTTATLSGTAFVTALGSDVVAVNGSGTGAFADRNAGIGKGITASGYSLTGADAANYNLIAPSGLIADIAKANLSVTGVSASDKIYDATTAATLSGTAVVSAVGGDVVNVTGAGSATFANKNAGSGKAVSVTGYALSGVDAGNYNVVQPTGLTATINKASLSVTGLLVANKVYDGTTAATLTGTGSVSGFGDDDISMTGSGSASFADKNAGANKAVTVSGYTLAGADGGNYAVVQPTGLVATVTRAGLGVSGLSVSDKTYDGTTAATLSGSATIAPLAGDAVALSGVATGMFADKAAGRAKAVNVSGYTLAGTDAGNYLLLPIAGLAATISPATLNVTGVTANSRVYDSTTAAALSGTASVNGIAGDVVAVAGGGVATFADRNVGTAKAVTVTGYSLAGVDAANYAIVQPADLVADISRATLTLGELSVRDKVYDGTTAASLGGTATVTPLGNDLVELAGIGAAAFADRNAGLVKPVTVAGFTLGGADASNYNLALPTGLTGNIARATLKISGVAALDKTYDGVTTANLSGSASVTPIGADVVSVAGTGLGAFADKNAGAGKPIGVTGYSLAGADAGNYELAPTNLTASINRASLFVTGVTANGRIYDATTIATLSGTARVTPIGGDTVSLAGDAAASFVDKNVGVAKVVTVAGYTLVGADANNYAIVQPTGLSAGVTPATIAIAGVRANGKVYNGNTTVTLTGTPTLTTYAGDAVSVTGNATGTLADKNVGTAKTVVVAGYGLTGTDAGNYAIVQPSGLTVDVTPAFLTVSGVAAADKVFDGTTAAFVNTANATLAGLIGSDSVTLRASGTFADPAAGTGKVVTLDTVYGGADAPNYTIVDQRTTTASITPLTATSPVTVTDAQQVRRAVTQIQTALLPSTAAATREGLAASSTITVIGSDKDAHDTAAKPVINTSIGSSPGAPTLRIRNGGMQLPAVATAISQ
jgi:filamentous hemagglutinin family protein